ncbi:MAG: PP2C family protein-serine/threonine phosphatase [Solirubrobacteraceae bacterium]
MTLLAGVAVRGGSPFSAAAIAAGTPASRARHASLGSHRSIGQPGSVLSPIPGLIGNLLPLPVPDWSKPIILGLLLVCAWLALRAFVSSRRARRLESQSHQLTADLEAMQAALVPAIPSRLGRLDVSVAYRPADGPAAGGDFYDAFTLDGGRVAFILGDVSGHGRHALARAAHMRYTLRAYVETGLDPRASLKLAGRVLGVEGDGLFTTVAIAVYDPDSATLTYASAGHPPPLLAGPGARPPLTASASPALGWGTATGRRQTTVPFSAGAQACFFSDGVIEARVGDELLGRDGLAELFTRTGRTPSASRLLEAVQEQAPTVRDDMAACVITAAAGTTLSEHRIEQLEADLNQLEAGQGARFLEACGVEEDQISPTIARAREVAAESGTVLLAVEQTGPGAMATVCEPTAVVLTTPSASLPREFEVGAGALTSRSLPLLG